MAPRLYVYKLTTDNGGAPCVDGGRLLTLAICKPRIRVSARVGDVLFGFAANSLSRDNRLIYIARVTNVEVDGDYYEKATYEHRGDRIYIRSDDGLFRVRADARYRVDGSLIDRDLGAFPDYERARVLVSDDFRYFGSTQRSRRPDLSPYPRLGGLLRAMGQGHRVNHPPELENELSQLLRSAWSHYSGQAVGSPSSPASPTVPPSGRRSRPSCG